jgi:molybdenum cofactor cytidylyltransferase
MTGIVGVLLAAGSARRFGAQKLLAALPDGEPVGLRAARNLLAAVPDVLAVVRPGDQALTRVLADTGLRIAVNERSASGIGNSIAAGVSASDDADGWLIALADMPWIGTDTIRAVAEALLGGAALAAPMYEGRRGHPVGFSSCWQQRLLSLTGDAGARSLIQEAHPKAQLLPTRDPGVLMDVDRPRDLALTVSVRR